MFQFIHTRTQITGLHPRPVTFLLPSYSINSKYISTLCPHVLFYCCYLSKHSHYLSDYKSFLISAPLSSQTPHIPSFLIATSMMVCYHSPLRTFQWFPINCKIKPKLFGRAGIPDLPFYNLDTACFCSSHTLWYGTAASSHVHFAVLCTSIFAQAVPSARRPFPLEAGCSYSCSALLQSWFFCNFQFTPHSNLSSKYENLLFNFLLNISGHICLKSHFSPQTYSCLHDLC